MTAETDRIMQEISAAVAAAGSDVDEIERRLTDGYAHALALEAERARLEKRLALVVEGGGVAGGRDDDELALLSAGLERAIADLGRLRGALSVLRRHASAVRAAS